jgi:hypothetical protein
MTYTKAIAKLIEDAKAANFEIKESQTNTDGDSQLSIFRRDRRSSRNLLLGVRLYLFNGAFHSAHRTDIDLGLTTNIRSIKIVRDILDLN